MTKNISPTEWEALSAFLDEQLAPKERARLELKLKESADLRAALEDLRRTRTVLRSTPRLRAPRSFALTAEMVAVRKAGRSGPFNWFPALRLTSALASLMLVVVVLGELLLGGRPAAAPMLAMQPAMLEQQSEAGASSESLAQSAPDENARNIAPEVSAAEEPAPTQDAMALSAPALEDYPEPSEAATGEVEAPPAAMKMAVTPTPEAALALAPAPENAYPVPEPSIQSVPETFIEAYPESPADTVLTGPAAQATEAGSAPGFWNAWRLAEASLALVAILAGLAAFINWRSRRI